MDGLIYFCLISFVINTPQDAIIIAPPRGVIGPRKDNLTPKKSCKLSKYIEIEKHDIPTNNKV